MNNLDALFDIITMIGDDQKKALEAFFPRKYSEKIAGRTAAELGGEPIQFMRYFQQVQSMSPDLLRQIRGN